MQDDENAGSGDRHQDQRNQQPDQPERKQGTTTEGAGERSDQDKRQDQMSNPDDAARQPTDQQPALCKRDSREPRGPR